MRTLKIIFIFLFIGIIYFPLANNIFHFMSLPTEEILPIRPRLDVKRLDVFPKKFENYFDKTLDINPWLVKFDSYLKIKVFGISPAASKIVVGKDGWLFLGEESIDQYKATNLFTEAQLKKIKFNLDERALYAKEKSGGVFYFIPIPLKHSIYSEFLPLSVRKRSPLNRTDQLLDYLKNDSLIQTIDVRPALMAHKKDHLLYYKTDNHWNDLGGYYAYHAIASEINKKFASVIPVGIQKFVTDSMKELVGGEALLLNAGDLFHEYRFDLYPGPTCKAHDGIKRGYESPPNFPYAYDFENVKETGDSSLPNALIIRDSFGDALTPLLSENFNHSVYIFDSWKYGPNWKIMESENPDIVLCMVLEKNLEKLLTNE
jgi:alginate O-acetyltransferase complex protein AlgJ